MSPVLLILTSVLFVCHGIMRVSFPPWPLVPVPCEIRKIVRAFLRRTGYVLTIILACKKLEKVRFLMARIL